MANIKPILTLDDPWRGLRKDLFGNTEVEVKLEGITMPVDFSSDMASVGFDPSVVGSSELINWKEIEQMPALAAGVSYGSKEKLENDPERAIKLNKHLIKLGHMVPIELIQFVFHISGISKACGAQLSRYRHTGHVSASRRYQNQKAAFVYPMLHDVKDKYTAVTRLKNIENIYRQSFELYEHLRTDFPDDSNLGPDLYSISKQDARMVIPVGSSTERTWWCNARELRHIFKQRLAPDSEPEIRRLTQILFNTVYPLTPSLFQDIREEFE